jgi:signal transduction histidine kinase
MAGSMMLGRLAIPMQRKDGSHFTAELSLQPIPLDESTGFTVFLRDITERERAARELDRQQKLIEQTNLELEQEIQVRRRAEEETRHRNQDLKTLLYVVSHDLREPLRSVRNFANLIQDRYAASLDDKGRDFLCRIIRGAERLDQQLADVLTLSRAQRLIEPDEPVALGEVVTEVLHQLEMRIQETGATLDVADDLPTVQADRSWAVQAVLNLVSNALKFQAPGTPPDVTIRRFESNGTLGPLTGLIVADRGPGVPPEHAERIFDLFQRAVGRDIEGTGAGLAIVRRIAERHGGNVWHQPREGGGSEFWLGFGKPPEA